MSVTVIGVVTDRVSKLAPHQETAPFFTTSNVPRVRPPAQGHPDHLARRGGQGAAALIGEPPLHRPRRRGEAGKYVERLVCGLRVDNQHVVPSSYLGTVNDLRCEAAGGQLTSRSRRP